jgi:hypothetical protein
MIKIDPYSGKRFEPLRTNQKYSCRENQIKFNNVKAQKRRSIMGKADQALKHNWKVCCKILGNNKEAIKSRDWLEALEYHFGYSTHFEEYGKGVHPAIYEFIIIKLEGNKYKIVKNDAY